MHRVGACFAVAAVAAITLSPVPSAAFGLSLGPFHLGVPFFGHRHRLVHRGRPAEHRSVRGSEVYDKASLPETRTTEPETHVAQRAEPALFYPGLALPALYDQIFWPARHPQWPFGYDAIFLSAFAKSPLDDDARVCQQADRSGAIVEHLRAEVRPGAAQLPLLQKLTGALGMASGYLMKACPHEIPAQATARLNLMQSQIQALTMAIDLIRPPLQQFEESLDAEQKVRFAAMSFPAAGTDCGAGSAVIDRSVDEIDQSVQPNDGQRPAMADLKQVFASVAADLRTHCPQTLPATPLARLEGIESRLDASWRAALSMQVALAKFETQLTAQQRDRFQAINLAESR